MTKEFRQTTVLLTRDEATNVKISDILSGYGVRGINFPQFHFVFQKANVDSFLMELKKELPQWVFLTSSNTVRALNLKRDAFSGLELKIKWACVGKKTALTLEDLFGVKPDLIANKASAQSLLNSGEFVEQKPLRVFLPQAKDARSELLVGLQERGHEVLPFTVYEKLKIEYSAEESEALQGLKLDWVFFFSPSAVQNLLSQNGDWKAHLQKGESKLAVIGETTKKALNEFGLDADFVPKESDAEAMIEELFT